MAGRYLWMAWFCRSRERGVNAVLMTFEKWFAELDRIGIKEGLFDSPDVAPLCSGSSRRRPYSGDDGLFRQCYDSGMTPTQALGEIGIED